jgi:8-oxo-dGTP pyrophosphatase MutT (NUDIX family)
MDGQTITLKKLWPDNKEPTIGLACDMPRKKKVDILCKRSYGIACCRYVNFNMEILLVKKRYTHQYAAFVFGHYKKGDERKLIFLFNSMTHEEKVDIVSMRFDLMWYRIWLEFPKDKEAEVDFHSARPMCLDRLLMVRRSKSSRAITLMDMYTKRKQKFEQTFCGDGGKYLLHLINGTTNGHSLWEIPKGHSDKKELPVDVAIRECKEETGLSVSSYDIIYDLPPIIDNYVSSNVRYCNEYFIAYSAGLSCPSNVFDMARQSIREIEEVRWVGLQELRHLDKSGHLTKLVKQVFSNIKYRYKILKQ